MTNKITYHMHGGSDCDGNGLFWSKDTIVDLTTGITTNEREDSAYGQCGNYVKNSLDSHITHSLTVSEQTAIYETLKPFVELKQKYPGRDSFQYFSKKQQYFYTGRASKALDLASKSDYCGIDNLSWVWVLPVYGVIIRIYTGSHDHYRYFTVKIESTLGWNDYDYYAD